MKVWICSDASYGGDVIGVSPTFEGAKIIGEKECDRRRELVMKALRIGKGTPIYKLPRRDVDRETKEWEEYKSKWDDKYNEGRNIISTTPNNHRDGLIIKPPSFFIQEFEMIEKEE